MNTINVSVPLTDVNRYFSHMNHLLKAHFELVRLIEVENKLKKHHRAYLHVRKKNNPKVISIYDPEFRNKIDLFIAGMEDRDGYVLQSLKAGITYREIGEELGITINRVRQIANRATRKIMNYIRTNS